MSELWPFFTWDVMRCRARAVAAEDSAAAVSAGASAATQPEARRPASRSSQMMLLEHLKLPISKPLLVVRRFGRSLARKITFASNESF